MIWWRKQCYEKKQEWQPNQAKLQLKKELKARKRNQSTNLFGKKLITVTSEDSDTFNNTFCTLANTRKGNPDLNKKYKP